MQSQKLNNQEIEEDILLIGGGPIGGFIAHIFASKFNFSVRVIERLPDVSDPQVEYQDRSGNFSLSYRATKVFHKYGLKDQYHKIVNPADHMTFVVDNMEIEQDFMPGKKLQFYPTARREMTSLLNRENKANKNIVYEYQTQVEGIDFQNNVVETLNLKTQEKLQRKFKFILGADGYRSAVRQSMDKQLIKDRNLPQDTVLTKLEENLMSTMNITLPDYPGYLQMQDDAKQGKYPWYNKLDDKYKKGFRRLCGKYIWDPSTLGVYGHQNLCAFIVPFNDGKMNIYIGLPRTKTSIQEYLDLHPEYKGSWRINSEINANAEELETEEQIHNFLVEHFPSFYGLCPDMVDQWKNSKVFSNYTVYCDNWYYNNQACLFGDACEGITYISGNGLNAALENMDNFFSLIEEKTQGEFRKFLSDDKIREEIFGQYQQNCYDYTRQLQISDVNDAVLPSLVQAQHPKEELYQEVEGVLFEKCDGIYNNKINLQYFSTENWDCIIKKADIFKNYIVDKLAKADKIEDIDLSNCKQDLVELLEKNNLPVNYTIEPSIWLNQ